MAGVSCVSASPAYDADKHVILTSLPAVLIRQKVGKFPAYIFAAHLLVGTAWSADLKLAGIFTDHTAAQR